MWSPSGGSPTGNWLKCARNTSPSSGTSSTLCCRQGWESNFFAKPDTKAVMVVSKGKLPNFSLQNQIPNQTGPFARYSTVHSNLVCCRTWSTTSSRRSCHLRGCGTRRPRWAPSSPPQFARQGYEPFMNHELRIDGSIKYSYFRRSCESTLNIKGYSFFSGKASVNVVGYLKLNSIPILQFQSNPK